MSAPVETNQTVWVLISSGGFTMYPLLICSFLSWGVIFERLWNFRKLNHHLRAFHLEAMNQLLRGDLDGVGKLCEAHKDLPTARLLNLALDRLHSRDSRIRSRWIEGVERKRQLINVELKRNLWILGTIGSASPFIGLFGTVVGILKSFQEMAKSGSGGFAVVAAGISESLITTAAGIVVAVIAVLAFNAFQTRWSHLVLTVRVQIEELIEILSSQDSPALEGGRELDHQRMGAHGHETAQLTRR